MCKVKDPSGENGPLNTQLQDMNPTRLKIMECRMWYLSHAEADPRSNLGHKEAASPYFLSTIK